jgi:fatty acid desaturase
MNPYKSQIDEQWLNALSRPSAQATALSLWWIYFPIILTVFAVISLNSLWVCLPAVLIIGNRQYAMYSLLHDGLHHLLHSDRKTNDRISRWLLAIPLGISMKKMRKNHLDHHRHLGHPGDPESLHLNYPEFQFPLSWTAFLRISFLDLSGLNWLYYRIKGVLGFWREEKYSLVALRILPLMLLLLFWKIEQGGLIILLWFFPLISVFQWLSRIRLSTEHFMLNQQNTLGTRTMALGMLESLVFSPGNLGYHTEHHLFPQVPSFQLPRLHKKLMITPNYSTSAEIQTSYFKLLSRFIQ